MKTQVRYALSPCEMLLLGLRAYRLRHGGICPKRIEMHPNVWHDVLADPLSRDALANYCGENRYAESGLHFRGIDVQVLCIPEPRFITMDDRVELL